MNNKVLFYRNFLGFTGGHKKIWDYYNHIKKWGHYKPYIYFTKNSLFNAENPWINISQDEIISEWQPEYASFLFLGGEDWLAVPENIISSKPIVNLIQGIRHSEPSSNLYAFLKNSAIRICVSQAVADAIRETKQVNGPIFVIPNGINIPNITIDEKNEYSQSILIVAQKNPSWGKAIHKILSDLKYQSELLINQIPQHEFFKKIKKAKFVILLPYNQEGFYLPGIETMALGTPLLIPDCKGNREYIQNNVNCLVINNENFISCVYQMNRLEEQNRFKIAGLQTAKNFLLEKEYRSFVKVMEYLQYEYIKKFYPSH